jgi:hypothetical protein
MLLRSRRTPAGMRITFINVGHAGRHARAMPGTQPAWHRPRHPRVAPPCAQVLCSSRHTSAPSYSRYISIVLYPRRAPAAVSLGLRALAHPHHLTHAIRSTPALQAIARVFSHLTNVAVVCLQCAGLRKMYLYFMCYIHIASKESSCRLHATGPRGGRVQPRARRDK